MALNCPKCRQPVAAEDVNVAADVAKCAACGEVFRASEALGVGEVAPARQDGVPPRNSFIDEPREARSEDLRGGSPNCRADRFQKGPPIDRLPVGSRVRVEQQGGTVAVHLPPAGFQWGLVFLIFFAIAWWSFLLTFIGIGAAGFMDKSVSPQHQSAPENAGTGPEAEAPPARTAPTPGDIEHTAGTVFSVFALLFLTPFFLAGIAMIFAILWPLFGRVEVRIEGRECLYRSSLFGIGRTRRAGRDDASLRWSEEALNPDSRRFGRSMGRRMQSGWGGEPHMLLALGAWETPLGSTISLREQEYVFQVLRSGLGQAAEPISGEGATGGLSASAERLAETPIDLKSPPPAKIVSWERGPDGSVRMVLPRRGFGRDVVGTIFFAVFWNLITVIVSGGFIYGMITSDVPKLLVLFFIPFWAVGIGMPLWACWQAWGTTELGLDRSGATLTRQLFGQKLVRQYAAEDLEPFSQEVAYSQNHVPVMACQLRAGRKKANFGHGLSSLDQEWLVAALNQAAGELGMGRGL
jgi:hypothetical protein